jgi:hypothetical protein
MMSRTSTFLFLLSLATLAFVLAGCESQRLEHLEKQTKELEGDVRRQSKVADYDLQSKCAREAKAWFGENWRPDKGTLYLDYTDHYSRQLNKCFILVEYHFSYVTSYWTNAMSLWDVQENSKFADFSESHLQRGDEDTTRMDACTVLDKKCSTLQEFNNLVGRYMQN